MRLICSPPIAKNPADAANHLFFLPSPLLLVLQLRTARFTDLRKAILSQHQSGQVGFRNSQKLQPEATGKRRKGLFVSRFIPVKIDITTGCRCRLYFTIPTALSSDCTTIFRLLIQGVGIHLMLAQKTMQYVGNYLLDRVDTVVQ